MGQAICPSCHLTNSDGNAITVCGQAHIVGAPQAACLCLNNRQKRGYALSNLRVRVQFLIHFLVAELQICHCLPTSVC